MSLSTAAIEKNHAILSKLITTWLKENPSLDSVSEVISKSENKSEEPKQVVTVALRTRPFLENETSGEEKKLLPGVHARDRKMFVHVPSSKWNGPTIQHKSFEGDFAFGPESSSEHVYESLVANLGLLETVLGGGVGCILAYGQTGSGKTYTISSLEDIISREIFTTVQSYASIRFTDSQVPSKDVFTIGISLYELLGNKVTDLLDRDENGDGVTIDIAEDKFGEIRVSAKVIPVTDPKQLAEMVATAASHRRTSATLKNETSSRSHCILNIVVSNTLVPSSEPGRLVMVDLAGSERAADRSAHTKERMEEARLINTSLMALKDCVRGRALVEAERSKQGDGKVGFQHIPYRSSKLTLALKPVFDVEATRHCKTVVIAHVSPHLADASHSSNTLTYVSPFRVAMASQATDSELSPATWSNADFRTWVGKTSSKIDPAKLAPFESGKQMCELEEPVFIRRCLESQKDELEGTTKELNEKGAKAFYDKLWGMIVAAKQNARPDELRTLTYNPPSMWSHFQVRDFIEKKLPTVDLEKLMPTLAPNPRRGRDFIQDMGEAEFILTLTSSNKEGEVVSVEEAKAIHTELWKIENDTWNATRTTTLTQRQDPNAGTGMDDILQFLDAQMDNPTIYGPDAGGKAENTALESSLLFMDNTSEGVARREEHMRQSRAQLEAQKAVSEHEKKLLEQWRREQMEGNN
ncbi:Diatom spindle kinesin 1 OS=Cylindrotheca fusiformis GN=DSK1 PE=2 SV=1 [Rhizoctonia solani AG-1 IB]|uniref:Kinesin-like protein n=1 Tax=Thanatephorus cucumeris (strain AG1-IB / isolate 7/3/14) TaxID=1108050 RepID=A0A0B7F8Y2_THACB|nr:Diatom spindle kinesin 1 OS=Cylindrotheca fusiformis GN=DSK1 PE=2 SV=1 [Rhizoctonia solani AG-1 IB]